MGSLKEHNRIVKEVLLAVSQTKNAIVWSNETGMALRQVSLTPFRYGLEGSPDIIGFLKNGKFIGFEIKSGRAQQSKEQLNFEKVCAKFNAHYAVVRNAGEAVERLNQWLGDLDARDSDGHESGRIQSD